MTRTCWISSTVSKTVFLQEFVGDTGYLINDTKSVIAHSTMPIAQLLWAGGTDMLRLDVQDV